MTDCARIHLTAGIHRIVAEPIDIGAEYRRVDMWSLQQAREGLADAIAKGLPISTEMYRGFVERLEESLAHTASCHAADEIVQ